MKTNGLHCGIAEADKKKIRLNQLTVVTAVRSSYVVCWPCHFHGPTTAGCTRGDRTYSMRIHPFSSSTEHVQRERLKFKLQSGPCDL